MPMRYARPLFAAMAILALGGCLGPHGFAQQAALDVTKSLGIGVDQDWYTSTVNTDPTIGHAGIQRAAAFEECEELGLGAVSHFGAQHGQMAGGMGHFGQGATWSTMNSQAKAAGNLRDECMMQKGFQRTRKW
ncbi:hypothetical protein [Caenispirillum salinarum]|uniref:hypothetical protein n=1 Tax=Caenispirillum salinarum TaxID=859058 RepID=UPI00384DF878